MSRAHELIKELEDITARFWSSDMETDEYVALVAKLTAQIKNSIPMEGN